MTGQNRGRGKLVADRRYPKKSATGAKAASKAKRPSGRKKPAAKRKPKPQGPWIVRILLGLLRWIGRVLWITISRTMIALALVIGLAVAYIYTTLPPVTDLLDGRARGSVTMLDRNGSVYAWRGEQFGGQITADTVSPHLKNAIIATEDKRFYKHFGVSPRGIASAIRINLSEGRGPLSGHGGSTLTQQVAKLLCLGTPYDPNEWESQAAYEADCRPDHDCA